MNTDAVSQWIARFGLWPLIVVLIPHLMFFSYGQAMGKKRRASLYQAIVIFLITILAAFIVEYGLRDIHFYAGLAVVLLASAVFRKKLFPYRLNCADCERGLNIKAIYFIDGNLCVDCRVKRDAGSLGDGGSKPKV